MAYRKMNTGDYTDDTMFKCGTTYNWKWAGSNLTGYVIMHNKKGLMDPLNLPVGCGNNVVIEQKANYLTISGIVSTLLLLNVFM